MLVVIMMNDSIWFKKDEQAAQNITYIKLEKKTEMGLISFWSELGHINWTGSQVE